MSQSTLDLLRRLEDSVKSDSPPEVEVIERPPFRAWVNQTTDLVWLNYAMPAERLDSAEQMAESVSQLRRDFGERNRVLRFEFIGALWPELPPVLESCGLVVQAIQPLLACWPANLRPFSNPAVSITALDPDDVALLRTYQRLQALGFGEDLGDESHGTFAANVAHLSERLRSGHMLAVVGLLDRIPAGAGALTPNGPTAELVGISTIPESRRRGVAATVSSFLIERYFREGGDIAWLSAGDEVAQKVYEKIGFRVVGSLLNYIDPKDNTEGKT